MKTRARLTVLVASTALAGAAAVAAGDASTALAPCGGADLAATFRVIPGSAGAGHIVYALRLRNTSSTTCFVTGIPGLILLDSRGMKLSTRATPAHPGALAAVLVRLSPGGFAHATARFSPDIPGPGEPVRRACEPTATGLRIVPNGGGTLLAQITPPTPVCGHGAMLLTVLTAG